MSKYVVNAHEMPSPTSKQKVKSRIKKESLKNFRKKRKGVCHWAGDVAQVVVWLVCKYLCV